MVALGFIVAADPRRDLRAADRQARSARPARTCRTRRRARRLRLADRARAAEHLVRRRPARPRRLLARALRRARLARGRVHRAPASSVLIGVIDRHDRRLLPRLGRHRCSRAASTSCSRSRCCCSASASASRAPARTAASAALIQPGLPVVIFVIVLANWPYIARIVRGQVLSLREKEFVEAARSLGASNPRIIFREILPNLVAPIIVYTTLLIPANILFEAALSFLGVGVAAAARRRWGAMISDATADLRQRLVVHVLPGPGAAAHRARLQPRRRRPAGRAQPADRASDRPVTRIQSHGNNPRKDAVHAQVLLADPRSALCALVALRRRRLRRRRRRAAAASSASTSQRHARRGQEGRHARRSSGAADVDFLDPGTTYYTFGYQVIYATQRAALLATSPTDAIKPVPDLADGDPRSPRTARPSRSRSSRASSSRRRSTARSRPRTSSTRSSARFTANVANGYAGAYFGDIVGAPKKPAQAVQARSPASRRRTTTTIVFKLTKGTGARASPARSRCRSRRRCPKEYAEKFDTENPSTYGDSTPVCDRPVHGRERRRRARRPATSPASRIHLVRNPNWDAGDDFRPAYLDEIDMPAGQRRHRRRRRAGSSSGENLVDGDIEPAGAVAQAGCCSATRTSSRLVPGGGWPLHLAEHDAASRSTTSTSARPSIAGFDRDALRQTRGGEALGDDRRTHFIPPGMPGFEEAGGLRGPGHRLPAPARRATRRCRPKYIKKAGYASGKYAGDEELLMVGDNADPAARRAEVAKAAASRSSASRSSSASCRRTRCTRSSATSPPAEGRDLPERRLVQGLHRPADDARPDLQRRRTSSRRGNIELAAARRPEDQQGDGRRQARHRAGTSAPRRGPTIDKMITEQAPGDPVRLGQDAAHPLRRTCNGVAERLLRPRGTSRFTSLK